MKKKKVLLGLVIAACVTASLSSCRKGTKRNYDDEQQKLDDLDPVEEEKKLENNQKYSINFDSNNGSNIITKEVFKDSFVTPIEKPVKAEDERASYEFVGWYLDNNTFNYLFNFDTKINENITLYAKYKENIKSYNVSFVIDDNVIKEETLKYGSNIIKPEDPVKESKDGVDYTFRGWFDDNGVKLTDDTLVNSNITYHAYFDDSLITYNVIYKNDDEILSNLEFHYGDDSSLNLTPTKEDTEKYSYEFLGWVNDDNQLVTDFTVLGDVTYYAKFKEIKKSYDISFYNGNELIKNEKINYGEEVGLPSNPTKDSTEKYSYEFIGWFDEDNNLITDFTVTKDISYHAKFKEIINTYSVIFKNGDETLSNMILSYGDNITLPNSPIKNNTAEFSYEFEGFYTDSNINAEDFGEVISDVIFYARFKETVNTYTLKFFDRDVLIKTETLKYGDVINKPADLNSYELNGVTYTFSGWYNENDELLLDGDVIKNEVIYYSHYVDTLNSYNVKFISNGDVIKTETLNYGSSIKAPNNPLMEGDIEFSYEFIGWYTNDNIKLEDLDIVSSDITFYARFKEIVNKYTISFKNGEDVISTNTLNYGSDIEAPANPTKEATEEFTYEFAGWVDENENLITDFGKVTGNETYTAKFNEVVNQYTITFKNGEDVVSTNTLNYGSDIVVPTDPTKDSTIEFSYEFDGWYTESGIKVIDFGTVRIDITYYARFKEIINQYTITFKNGEDIVSSTKLNYGTDIQAPQSPTKASTEEFTYEFVGWLDENNNPVTEFGKVSGNKTYTAKINEIVNQYNVYFYDENNNLIYNQKVNYGEMPSYNGILPSKDSDLLYDYEFDGFDLKEVLNDQTYFVTFTKKDRKYIINWVKDDVILRTDNDALYNKEFGIILEPYINDGIKYVFNRWDESIDSNIITRTAIFDEEKLSYSVTFKNYDGTILESKDDYKYGDKIIYNGLKPIRESSVEFDYNFIGWDKELGLVTSDMEFVAKYENILREYAISFYNGDTLIKSINVKYGFNPIYDGITPSKEATVEYSYEFIGWNKDLESVTKNENYYASFKEIINQYTIIFKNGEDIVSSNALNYGSDIEAPANPTKEATEEFTYDFAGWLDENNNHVTEFGKVAGNKIYTAKFNEIVNQYTITFKVGEDVISTNTLNYGSDIVVPTDPSKDSTVEFTYEFDGWYTESGIKVTDFGTVRNDVTYYARFKEIINQYTIIFKNGEDIISSTKLNYGADIQVPQSPTKTSTVEFTYVFAGWLDENENLITDFGKVTGNETYTAKFNEVVNQYTITFKNGEDVISTNTLNYGSDIVVPTDPTKDSTVEFTYEFDGWYTKSGIKVIDFGTVRNDITYYARFKEIVNQYTITFKNGDDILLKSTLNYGSNIDVPANPTKEATQEFTYEFDGWVDENNNLVTDFGKVSGNKTYTAKFNEIVNQYTITFKNGEDIISSNTLNYGSDIVVPTDPTKDSTIEFTYEFDGWYTESGIKVIDFGTIRNDVTYYASFKEIINQYTIIFKNGDDVVSSNTLNYGSDIEAPANPTKEATEEFTYDFAGWLDENNNLVTEFGKVAGNKIYTAKFNEIVNQYTITFKVGEDVISTNTLNYGSDIVVPTDPSKDSTVEFTYEFDGWYTESGIKFIDFGTVRNDITYYARFKEIVNQYTITFKNGDDILLKSTLNYGSNIDVPANPTKEATQEFTYEFDGWVDENNNLVTDFGKVSGNKTYTAKFNEIINQYTYKFYLDDGTTLLKEEKANYGSLIVSPTVSDKEYNLEYYYKFIGFYTDLNSGTLVTDFGKLNSNVTYYARFSKEYKRYLISWRNYDNSVLKTDYEALYNTTYEGITPTKDLNDGKKYVFKSWSEIILNDTITRIALFDEVKEEYVVKFVDESNNLLKEVSVFNGDLASYDSDLYKNGYKFVGWYLNGELFDLNTPITHDLVLVATYAETNKIGFGNSYTPWANLVSEAGSSVSLDTSNRYLLNKDVELNNFTFINNNKNVVLEDKSGYNTQGSSIKVKLNNVSDIVVDGVWASKNSGYVTIKGQNGLEVYKSELNSNGSTISINLKDLEAGTYTIVPDYSIRISNLYYETIKEYTKVSFVSNCGFDLDPVRVIKGDKLVNIPEITNEGYKLVGWYLDPNFNSLFDLNSSINTDIILYAKWTELSIDESVNVNFISNVDLSFDSVKLEKGSSVVLPNKDIDGYRFSGWYIDSSYNELYNGEAIMTDTTLYGKYIKQWTITYLDKNGSLLGNRIVDNETIFSEVSGIVAPYINGEVFEYWTLDDAEFKNSTAITSNIILKAKYVKDNGAQNKITITRTEGLLESAYVLFNKYENAEGYQLYEIKGSETYELSYKDFYITNLNGNLRADIFGLTKGSHTLMVAPVIGGSEAISLGSTFSVNVEEYDRSGYAHYNYDLGVGAYNDDGTLKKNAIVLYVTDENKNSIELSYKGITVKGIGNILNSAGEEKSNGLASTGGKANTNQGIIKLLAQNNIPLVVRFVGVVSNTGLYEKGTFDAKKTGLIEGLTVYNSTDNGGTVKDNGHMARIKSGKDITIEGVGEGATIDGFGFHFMCESSASNLGKSFEVRNLKFINTPEDAIGMEGVQDGSKLTASVERCWVHNNEFYCPSISNAAESDKSEGDGSCDFKRGMYFTCSYNYFEGCHKTNLVGSSDTSLQYNLTYHHNYWYMCKARGPLARMANIHMYNNIFYGQTDYAMNTRANAYIFSESNLFYACKNPFRVDGGAIKSFNDSVSSAITGYTQATVVSSYDEKVASGCAYDGTSYSSFELNENLFYKNDYYLQADPTDAKKVIYARCGTAKASLPQIDDITMSDISYVNETVSNVTINNLAVGSVTNIDKLSKSIYAFKITSSATATITFADNSDTGTGILCNEAGVCLLKASGSVNLKPGIYFIQPYTVQAGDSKTLSKPVFKEIKNITLKLDSHDDTEYQNQLINEFNALVNNLPTIGYNDNSISKINLAYDKYNQLDSSSKQKVQTNYNKLNNAYNTYKSLGEGYVEGLINNLPINVTVDNADLIYNARKAYNELKSKVSDAYINNYNDLLAAEAKLDSVAVTIFINKVEAITNIKYDTETLKLINNAYNAYDSLTDNQKALDDVKAAYTELNNKKQIYDNLELEANTFTVNIIDGGNIVSTIKVLKGNTITLPNIIKDGYRLEGFYTNNNLNESSLFNLNTKITANMNLYTKFIKQYIVTFKNLDGSTLITKLIDDGKSLDSLPEAKYESGYKFKYWSLSENGDEYTYSDILANTTLYAVYEKSLTKSIEITDYAGEKEVLYAEFLSYEGLTDYNAYISSGSDYKLIDKQLIRLYKGSAFNYYRVDVPGLKAGTYSLKIVAINNNEEVNSSGVILNGINVISHERTGFGFVNGSSSGAYNDDGTLKQNAKVIYVSNSNKDTVTLDGYVGVQNIISAMKGKKYISYPVCIRMIGNILDPANMPNGDLYLDGVSNITIEGIGTDATLNGFGIVIKNSSNVEIRNLGFMNCNSTEGDDCGLQQANDHVWVHNCDFFYGDAGSDSDQAKGDGALDTKKSTYVTHSYNHFFDNGKCNLQGMKSESTENYITYHHNWYDHSDSRHPRIRTCTVHIYNNYFDGNAKYGVGMTMGGSAFVENNYFRSTASYTPMMISMQGTDALGEGTFSGETGGIIKAYGNTFDGANVRFISQYDDPVSFDAYVVSSRNEQIPSSVKSVSGGTSYNNFDTNTSLMYSYDVETPEVAKANVIKYAGRIQGGDFKWTFTDSDDADYAVNKALKQALVNYKDNIIQVLGIENQGESSSGNQNDNPTVDSSYEEVISLIDNLPEPANVKESDRVAINYAKAKYDALDSNNKAKVTNVNKLNSCILNLPELTSFTIDFVNATCGSGSNVTAYNENNILITCSKIASIDQRGLKFNSNYGFVIKNNSTNNYRMTLTLIGNGNNKSFNYNGTSVTFGTSSITVTIDVNANSSVEFITPSGGAYLTKIEVE